MFCAYVSYLILAGFPAIIVGAWSITKSITLTDDGPPLQQVFPMHIVTISIVPILCDLDWKNRMYVDARISYRLDLSRTCFSLFGDQFDFSYSHHVGMRFSKLVFPITYKQS